MVMTLIKWDKLLGPCGEFNPSILVCCPMNDAVEHNHPLKWEGKIIEVEEFRELTPEEEKYVIENRASSIEMGD